MTTSWSSGTRTRLRHVPVGRRPDWLLRMLVAGLLVVATAACAEPAQPHRAGWRMRWTDDFDGSNLDRTKWAAENESTFGEGNLELACLMDRPENLFVADGRLHVRAAREPTPVVCGDNDERFPKGRSYTSAMITTQGKAPWREGRPRSVRGCRWSQARPRGCGPPSGCVRPAVRPTARWTRWKPSGPRTPRTLRRPSSTRPCGTTCRGLIRSRDIWRSWSADRGWLPHLRGRVAGGPRRWYVIGKLTFQRDRSTTPWLDEALAAKFFIRLNMAVGVPGHPAPSTRFPADMVVDWVEGVHMAMIPESAAAVLMCVDPWRTSLFRELEGVGLSA